MIKDSDFDKNLETLKKYDGNMEPTMNELLTYYADLEN